MNRGHEFGAICRLVGWQIASRLRRESEVPFVDRTKLVVSRGMHGATGNIYCGLHEPEEMAFTLHLLRPGDLFIDVGANVGSYSLLAATAGADVIAFEPGERYPALRRNIEANRFAVDCRNQAVGAAAGVMNFTIGLDAQNRFASEGEEGKSVQVVALDEAIPRPATLIKIDVEGHEGAVLAGGRNRIAEAQAVILELCGQGQKFGYDEDAIARDMLDLGFRRVSYDPFVRRLAPSHGGANALFVKPGLEDRLRDAPRFKTSARMI